MKRLPARLRALWYAITRGAQLDAAMDDEMRHHIELHAERLMREERLDAQEAHRRAHIAFGGLEKYKEATRDTRGLRWLDAISLDTRLGVRMLVKHRGLTLVGGFAMTVAIAAGATFFEVLGEMLDPALPFEDGGRIVALQYASATSGRAERRVLHDFLEWRDALASVEHLGAFRTVQHNLASGDMPPEPVKVAEISASAFVLAGTPPLVGRYLVQDDERPSAAPVVVLGYHAWQARFGSDPELIGRPIILGGIQHSVVGVMPEGFKFPLDHQFWIPLRLSALPYDRLEGPAVFVFGRLVAGATLEVAQAELTTVGEHAAASSPQTHGRLRPMVLPYTREHLDMSDPAIVWILRIAQLLVGALVFVVSVNLAILVYARTVTRLGEFAVRTALGASRRRILAQLFVEALTLALVGAVAGLTLADIALERIRTLATANGSLPFWLDFQLSLGTVLYAFALTLISAGVMGVWPGLKATGRRVSASLHELNGRAGTRLGPMWSTLVVAQVAVAVAVLPLTVYMTWQVVRMEFAGPGFAAERFVVGTLALSGDAVANDRNSFRWRQLELMSRLAAEPGVSAVTFSSSAPGFAGSREIEFDAATPLRETGWKDVTTNDVDIALFDTYGVPMLAGRVFTRGDVGAARNVIVNRTFERHFLADQRALGVRFRFQPSPAADVVDRAPEWFQVVGVVRDFPSFPTSPGSEGEPTIYRPVAAGDVLPVTLSVRFGGRLTDGFVDRFRTLAAEVDPALQVRRAGPLAQFYGEVRSLWRYVAWGIGVLTASVLLLSAAGIYALMSFTVAQRTREIGIRAALGAHPRRILLNVFSRVTGQLGIGVAVGSLVSGAVFAAMGLSAADVTVLLVTVAGIMLIVGLLAAFGPARRGLKIDASEALRAEA